MRKYLTAGFIAAMISHSSGAFAAPMDFDFSGTFTNDNDIVLLDFSVGSDSNITIFSSSWIDGDSGLGFDPILAIWDADGNLVQEQDDGGNIGSTMSNDVLYAHGEWDTYFDVFLASGSYTASIGQYDNFAVSNLLSDGFEEDGNPNFTFDNGFGPEAMFNGVWSDTDARTGDWEFHILNVDEAIVVVEPTPVSVPATFALFGLGLAGIAWSRRNRV